MLLIALIAMTAEDELLQHVKNTWNTAKVHYNVSHMIDGKTVREFEVYADKKTFEKNVKYRVVYVDGRTGK